MVWMVCNICKWRGKTRSTKYCPWCGQATIQQTGIEIEIIGTFSNDLSRLVGAELTGKGIGPVTIDSITKGPGEPKVILHIETKKEIYTIGLPYPVALKLAQTNRGGRFKIRIKEIIEGKVVRSSRVKEYPVKDLWENMGRYVTKFWMLVKDTNEIEFNVMVHMDGVERTRPSWGDSVKFSVMDLNADGWCSITADDDYEITDDAGQKAWEIELEEMKLKEDKEWKKKRDEERKKKIDAKRLSQHEHAKYIEKLADWARPLLSWGRDNMWGAIVNPESVIRMCREVYTYGPVAEGEGGKAKQHEYDDWWPGSGLRAPNRIFHGMPKSQRTAMIRHCVENFLVEVDVNGKFIPTAIAKKVLETFDVCKKCDTKKEAHMYESYYSYYNGPTIRSKYVIFECKCEHNKMMDTIKQPSIGMSNSGATYRGKIKSFEERFYYLSSALIPIDLSPYSFQIV